MRAHRCASVYSKLTFPGLIGVEIRHLRFECGRCSSSNAGSYWLERNLSAGFAYRNSDSGWMRRSMSALDSHSAVVVVGRSKKVAGLRDAAVGSPAFAAGPVGYSPGYWDSVAERTVSFAGPAIEPAACSHAYSLCSRSRNCCRMSASPSRYFCRHYRPSRRTCLRLKT
jgi:hypothetical protein